MELSIIKILKWPTREVQQQEGNSLNDDFNSVEHIMLLKVIKA